jgi:hypothetical protein
MAYAIGIDGKTNFPPGLAGIDIGKSRRIDDKIRFCIKNRFFAGVIRCKIYFTNVSPDYLMIGAQPDHQVRSEHSLMTKDKNLHDISITCYFVSINSGNVNTGLPEGTVPAEAR